MTASARDIIFNHSERVAPLGLIAIPGSEELGKKVNDYLVTWSREAGYDYDNFLIENECPRFSSGDGKALIKNTVRGLMFILLPISATTALNIRCSAE